MSFHIFVESLKIRGKENFLLMVQCILVFVLVIAAGNTIGINKKKQQQLDKTAGDLYKLNDNYIGVDEKRFFAQPDNVLLLKKFYEWEKNSPLWEYLIANRQPVGTVGKVLDSVFEYGYENGMVTENTYKSIQVNDNFLQHFSIKASQGELFSKGDYEYQDGKMPILLGSKYQGVLKLHEKVEVEYLGYVFPCEVKGFLEENSYYNNGYDLIQLDYYIMLPSIENFMPAKASSKEIKSFELKLYLDKCAGYISTDLNRRVVQTQIARECYAIDLVPYSIEGTINYYPTMWGLEGRQLGEMFLAFACITMFASIICISLNMAVKVSHMERDYVVYIINGANKSHILLAVWEEILFVVFLAGVSAVFLSWLYWGELPVALLILSFFAVCILSSIYPCRMLQKINLSLR